MRPVTLFVLIFSWALVASADDVIRVKVSCPGTDARTLDVVILSPIIRQINGIKGLSRIESEARDDGNGILSVNFLPKTDLAVAEVLVQNRVNLALSLLPDDGRYLKVSVRTISAGPPQFYLALTSSDAIHDEGFLNKFAIVNLKPHFAAVVGVTDVRVVGGRNIGMQVKLNPSRLAAYRLMDSDVVEALRRQNSLVGASGIIGGKQSNHTVVASGRLNKPDAFESVILKSNADGEVVRLKDVAEVDIVTPWSGFARLDGRPAALIEVTTWPGRLTASQLMIEEVLECLAPGMSLNCVADRSIDRLLLVEVRLSGGSTLDQTQKVVEQASEHIRRLPGKPSVFAVGETHEPNLAMVFVKASGKSPLSTTDVEKSLDGLAGAKIRICDVPPGKAEFAARMALVDLTEFGAPEEEREERFREVADRVLTALAKDKDIEAPGLFPPPPTPQYIVDVDRDMSAQSKVELDDIFTALQSSLGGVHATDFSRFGTTYWTTVQTDPQFGQFPENLSKVAVRSADDQMISIRQLIKIRESTGPVAVMRIDGCPSIEISAAPGAGKSASQIAAKCIKLAREVLPRGYRAIDLTNP